MPEFGPTLKALREKAGLSVAELAEKAGLQRTHVHALERGYRARPSWDVVQALARALGISTEEFRSE